MNVMRLFSVMFVWRIKNVGGVSKKRGVYKGIRLDHLMKYVRFILLMIVNPRIVGNIATVQYIILIIIIN